MIQAVIFDMDGLMINSKNIWKISTIELLAQFGKIHDPEFACQFSGLKSHDVASLIKNHYQLPVSVDYLSETRNKMALKLAQSPVKTMPGLTRLFSLLKRLGYKKAVATSSYRTLAHQLLKSARIYDQFDTIVTGEDVIMGKPAPDIFLHTAQLLQTNPKHCLVLEDASAGIEAAHAAGMKSIAVNKNHSVEYFPLANHVFSTLSHIDISILQSL